MTKGEAVKIKGLNENKIDYALPEEWVDRNAKTLCLTGIDLNTAYNLILANGVWYYENSLLGFYQPITEIGVIINYILANRLLD